MIRGEKSAREGEGRWPESWYVRAVSLLHSGYSPTCRTRCQSETAEGGRASSIGAASVLVGPSGRRILRSGAAGGGPGPLRARSLDPELQRDAKTGEAHHEAILVGSENLGESGLELFQVPFTPQHPVVQHDERRRGVRRGRHSSRRTSCREAEPVRPSGRETGRGGSHPAAEG